MVDTGKRRVKTDHAGEFEFDRLMISTGIDFNFAALAGYDEKAQEKILHARKAGP